VRERVWRVGFCSAYLLSSIYLQAQELSCGMNQYKVRIGETVQVHFRAEAPKNSKIIFEAQDTFLEAKKIYDQQKDSITEVHLELTEKFSIDTKQNDSTKYIWHGHYTVRSWEYGKIIIAPQKILINDSVYFFEPITFTIVEPSIGKDGELFDIEETFANVPKKKTFIEWITKQWKSILMIFIITTISIIVGRKKMLKKQLNTQKTNMSLKDRTLFAIDALYKQKLWEKDMMKYHYSELSYIIRAYLSSRYNINLLECTTQQAYSVLMQTNISRETIQDIADLLIQADIVKFSKIHNDKFSIEYLHDFSKRLVNETSPLKIDYE